MTRRVKRTLGGEDRFCAAHRNPVVIGFFHSVRILVKTVVRGWWVWLGLALGFGSLGGFFWQQEQPAIALPCLLIAIFFVLYALFSEARKSISHIFDSSKALVLDVASSCLWYLASYISLPWTYHWKVYSLRIKSHHQPWIGPYKEVRHADELVSNNHSNLLLLQSFDMVHKQTNQARKGTGLWWLGIADGQEG